MDEQEHTRLEGIVHADRYDQNSPGKQFLGAAIECSDAKVWVIAYAEQSPFHVFAGRKVVAYGEPYRPRGQVLMAWSGGRPLGHFRVASLRPVEVTADAKLLEVGAEFQANGRFERVTGDTEESILVFVTESGESFRLANEPAGARVGQSVAVSAYPVLPSPLMQRPPGRYLWVICPHSAQDLWDWRAQRLRKSNGLV